MGVIHRVEYTEMERLVLVLEGYLSWDQVPAEAKDSLFHEAEKESRAGRKLLGRDGAVGVCGIHHGRHEPDALTDASSSIRIRSVLRRRRLTG